MVIIINYLDKIQSKHPMNFVHLKYKTVNVNGRKNVTIKHLIKYCTR